MPSLFSSSVKKSELVSMRSGVSNSEPTAMISAFILRESREPVDFLTFFRSDHVARKLFEIPIQKSRREILQIEGKVLERIKRVRRETWMSVTTVRAQRLAHIGLMIDRCLSEVIRNQPQRIAEMDLEFPVCVHVRPTRVRASAAWPG